MPPPTRIAPAAPGLSARGSEKALPSGPVTQTLAPASSSQSRSVPGPIPSIRKSSRAPARGRAGLGDRDRSRQERTLAGLLPVGLGGEHVELAGQRRRPVGVEQREDAIAAGGTSLADPAEAAPEGSGHRGWAARARPWISCRLRTSASPWLPAAIARAAAVAPVIVVTQGMP